MKHLIRNKNFWIILGSDILFLFFAYFLSYFIRFEGDIPPEHWSNFKKTVGFIIPLKIFAFMICQIYKGMWRYISIVDLLNLVKAILISSILAIGIVFLFYGFEGFARSVFVLDAVITFLLIGGVRISIRLFLNRSTGFPNYGPAAFSNQKSGQWKRIIIIGAGDAGEKILREIRDNPRLQYRIVGFLDDNPRKHGMRIHGVPVLGSCEDVIRLARSNKIDEILIAISAATSKEMRRIVDLCKNTNLKFKTIPGIGELIDGRVSVKAIRDVSYEDLMGREPVRLEMEKIGEYISGKRILVTGAGGSIGSELCRQAARFNPERIILLDCTENNLYQVEIELRNRFPKLNFTSILGNVIHKEVIQKVFQKHSPAAVFHAAAYKHVPLMEMNPWEAVFTNIRGTQVLLEAAREFHVERFVFVSTDKAVRPTNVLGVSKRVAEMLTQAYRQNNQTSFVSVRFGNVIGSSGSVIPLFRKQIESGGPVTVTHPEVTRYFMTISEAAQLILQAGAMGRGGEIFILNMGTPIKILDLAKDLISLSGFEPERDIEIKFIGLRPGEKLYEELITEGEGIVSTNHEKIMVLRGNDCNLQMLEWKIRKLIEYAKNQDEKGIKITLKEIVPEYQPFGIDNSPSSAVPRPQKHL